ncbi:MAG TPA: c-type cytochrome [Chitinophagaceae bacterium]
MKKALLYKWVLLMLFLLIVIVVLFFFIQPSQQKKTEVHKNEDSTWIAPSLDNEATLTSSEKEELKYGRELIIQTAKYFGPQGIISKSSNGMNCQNCHLDAGTRAWGNSFGAVYSTYPKFRARSGSIETVYRRIYDCFERSMNGVPPDTASKEIKAMHAYLIWLGKDVPKGKRPYSTGLNNLPLLNRAADTAKGRTVFVSICQPCHGTNGEGQMNLTKPGYRYPPLWGKNSYNDGAGLYRLSAFADFVYNNMPYNRSSHKHPILTIEKAWDVAAFVNSQPRPHKNADDDYKDLTKKPFDHPFGPYADTFSQRQHKYGPYHPIIAANKKK